MKPALATRESRLAAPTGSVLQCILGTLLGDGCVDARPTNPRLCFIHGKPQEAYARHKALVLKDYVQTPPKLVPNMGYGSVSCTFRTVTTPAFDFLREICLRREGERYRKTVTREWLQLLTWEGVAYWFLDDGSLTKNHANISTHSFTEAEVRLLAGWLAERGVVPCVDTLRTKAGKVCWILRLRKEATTRLIEHIRPFVPECMAYKAVPPAPTPVLPCCVCGRLRSGKAPSAANAAPLCGDPACTRARNMQTHHQRHGRTGKKCRCGAPLVAGNSKRLCDGCRVAAARRHRAAKRQAYAPVPTADRECFWCGAHFRVKGGTVAKHPSCGSRECAVHARRIRRDPSYVRKPVTWFRVPVEAFLNRRARSKEVA